MFPPNLLAFVAAVLLVTSPFPANADDEPVAAPVAAAADEESLEITFKGQTFRVRIRNGIPEDLDLGDSKLQFKFERSAKFGESSEPEAEPESDESPSPKRKKAQSDTATPSRWSLEMIVMTSVMGGLLVCVLGYFFVIDPMLRRRPLREAMQIIQLDHRPRFPHAEELLEQSLLAGLRRKDIARARFALAYLRGVLGEYEEAATVLGELEKSQATIDRPTAYLMLWVQSRLKNHERVERVYNEHAKLLTNYQQTALIVSISFLAQAQLRWARRETAGAMHYFDAVRQLGVLADEIPNHIDDHEVVMGTLALFEKNTDQAKKHFDASIAAASQRNKPTHPGQLGRLLCDWRTGDMAAIDEPLGRVLAEMQPKKKDEGAPVLAECPHCAKSYRVKPDYVGRKVQCKGCRRRFVVEPSQDQADAAAPTKDDAKDSHDRLLSEDELLLRNVRLWHCLTRLLVWMRFKERSGLPDAERKTLKGRLLLVTQMDPDFGDPHLVGGLIDYYFSQDDEQRKQAVEQIQQAIQRDVHVPEVLQLIDRENKLAALSQQCVTYFHQLAQNYSENPEVDPELQDKFVRLMNRHAKVRELGTLRAMPKADSLAPSLENLQGRGQILQTRVKNIVSHRLQEADPQVRLDIVKQLSDLELRSQKLAEGAKAFQQSEFGLMESTGEFLFADEEPTDEAPTDAEEPANN
ncbi:MAG: hypothetical protein ACKV2Q_33260 [Planctomycetaceae bacterium]